MDRTYNMFKATELIMTRITKMIKMPVTFGEWLGTNSLFQKLVTGKNQAFSLHFLYKLFLRVVKWLTGEASLYRNILDYKLEGMVELKYHYFKPP